MSPAWRRLLVPLAISLLGHALLLYVVGLVPRVEEGEAIVHGALHLVGMDHEVDDGQMLAVQAEILSW